VDSTIREASPHKRNIILKSLVRWGGGGGRSYWGPHTPNNLLIFYFRWGGGAPLSSAGHQTHTGVSGSNDADEGGKAVAPLVSHAFWSVTHVMLDWRPTLASQHLHSSLAMPTSSWQRSWRRHSALPTLRHPNIYRIRHFFNRRFSYAILNSNNTVNSDEQQTS
jgi:hypothetical protein